MNDKCPLKENCPYKMHVLSENQFQQLKAELITETKQSIKEEALLELGAFTYEKGKSFLFSAIQIIGLIVLIGSVFLYNKGIISELKL